VQAAGLETERGGEMFLARRFRDALAYFDKAVALDSTDPALLLKQVRLICIYIYIYIYM